MNRTYYICAQDKDVNH